MKKILLSFALFSAGLLSAAHAQAPAGAPAGANGICKDGTYSTAAKKDGACRGHKGVQTWYAATPAASSPAPNTPAPTATATTPRPAAMPTPTAPTTAAVPRATPAPTPAMSTPTAAAAPAPAGTKRLSPAAAAAQKPQAPGGGPGLVWVNTASNVYHCNGDPFYGKTKAGAYMSEADAKAKGAHGDAGKSCVGK